MAEDSSSEDESISRRKYLVGAGAAGIAGLAGCSGGGGGNTADGSGGSSGDGTTTSGGSGGAETDSGASNNAQPASPLTADGSSTVYPITSDGASVWNSNPPADDKEYWGPGQYDIETDKRLADYWAGLYGFEAGSAETQPPFLVNIGLSHSGTGVSKVHKGQVDIGDSSAPVEDELPDLSQSELDKFVDHVVGVDGQPVVVSRAIKEAGVEVIDIETLKKIYKGEIENWSNVPNYNGPDKQIQAIGRAEGSGTDTAFRANVFGNPDAPIPGVDVRKGQNQQVQTLVGNSDNAIAYLALAFVAPEGPVPPIGLRINDTVYEYGKNLGAKEYPLSRDLHAYTYDGTSEKEAAFIRMLLHDYGQQNFVAPNNYFKLPQDRQKKQLEKLPEPTSSN